MNCRQVQKHLDNFLLASRDEAEDPALAAHLETCPRCREQYELARRAMASIQLSHKFRASSNLKERIMNSIYEASVVELKPKASRSWRFNWWRPLWVVAAAASLVALVSLSQRFGLLKSPQRTLPAISVLAQARAAEEALFAGERIIHLVNEILVKPVSNPVLAGIRWIPVMALDAAGKPQLHQLALPAEPNQGFTVQDQSWYDPTTGRFARVMTLNGRALFANSYDGSSVYSLETTTGSMLRLVGNPITANFKPPKNPAEFLGIAAGLPNVIVEKDKSVVSDAGEVKLNDGSPGRALKSGIEPGGPEAAANSFFLFKIRTSDNTIAEIEWMAEGQSLLEIRRVKTEPIEESPVAWNLAGIVNQTGEPSSAPLVGILPNMVVPDVSVQRMIEKADFETYIFATDLAWAGERHITDILDIVSPTHRMFAITYRAKDGRHVVLIQSFTYNMMLGPMVKTGKVVYESPKGFKVWSGPRDKWLAGILLKSARSDIKDAAVEDRTGYMIETPAGTFPALAINGQVSEKELHDLIDSLMPAKEYRGK